MIDITQIFVGTATLVVAHAQTHLHTALSCLRPVVQAGAIRSTGGEKEPLSRSERYARAHATTPRTIAFFAVKGT